MSVIEAPPVEDDLKVIEEIVDEPIDYEKCALDHVNDVRNLLGLDPLEELLPGSKGFATSCPIALSIQAGTERDALDRIVVRVTSSSTEVIRLKNRKVVHLCEVNSSNSVKHFIKRFDGGYFPHLEKGVH